MIFNKDDVVLDDDEVRILQSIVDGFNNGDYYCGILLDEYDIIRENVNKRKLFLKTLEGKTSENGYKEWYYIDKGIFIDTRSYL
jgi:hypothetical protein